MSFSYFLTDRVPVLAGKDGKASRSALIMARRGAQNG